MISSMDTTILITFSILERIDDVVTSFPRCAPCHWSPFSILERIDDVVTRKEIKVAGDLKFFQYPRTDRRCCDLQVMGMVAGGDPTFSILERIDDVVTVPLRPHSMHRYALSVSSNGSTML